jgi:hypothetical protein
VVLLRDAERDAIELALAACKFNFRLRDASEGIEAGALYRTEASSNQDGALTGLSRTPGGVRLVTIASAPKDRGVDVAGEHGSAFPS